jgi:hypothetical protein
MHQEAPNPSFDYLNSVWKKVKAVKIFTFFYLLALEIKCFSQHLQTHSTWAMTTLKIYLATTLLAGGQVQDDFRDFSKLWSSVVMPFVLISQYSHKLQISNWKVIRSQQPRGLRCGSAAARLLEMRIRILPTTWMSVPLCLLRVVGLIAGPEEFYRVWCVWVWSCSLDNEKALAHQVYSTIKT